MRRLSFAGDHTHRPARAPARAPPRPGPPCVLSGALARPASPRAPRDPARTTTARPLPGSRPHAVRLCSAPQPAPAGRGTAGLQTACCDVVWGRVNFRGSVSKRPHVYWVKTTGIICHFEATVLKIDVPESMCGCFFFFLETFWEDFISFHFHLL